MSERCLTKLFFLTFYSTLPITGTVPTYKDFRSKLSMNSLFNTTLLWPKISDLETLKKGGQRYSQELIASEFSGIIF